MRLCLNTLDPRLSCKATGVKRLVLRGPASFVGAAAVLSGATASGPVMIFAPPLTEPNVCTHAVLMQVPLRRRGRHLRPGKTVIRATAKGVARGRDVDRVKLVCDPPR